MGLSEFPDGLLPSILHFGGVSMEICRHCLLFSHLHLVAVDLPDNFLNLVKVFSGYGAPTKLRIGIMTVSGWGGRES
jgi:hypothetical protein